MLQPQSISDAITNHLLEVDPDCLLLVDDEESELRNIDENDYDSVLVAYEAEVIPLFPVRDRTGEVVMTFPRRPRSCVVDIDGVTVPTEGWDSI